MINSNGLEVSYKIAPKWKIVYKINSFDLNILKRIRSFID